MLLSGVLVSCSRAKYADKTTEHEEYGEYPEVVSYHHSVSPCLWFGYLFLFALALATSEATMCLRTIANASSCVG